MAKKSSELNSNIDKWTNFVNFGLTVIGIVFIVMGMIYLNNSQYDYLVKIGTIIIVAGAIAICIGVWGVITHARTMKVMKAQAKADLNY